MKKIFIILIIGISSNCFSQTSKRQIVNLNYEVLNDLIHSHDFTPQIKAFERRRNDTDLAKIFTKLKHDSIDTSVTKKLRISFLGTQLDRICIVNKTLKYGSMIEKLFNGDISDFNSEDILFMKVQLKDSNFHFWRKKIKYVRFLKSKSIQEYLSRYGSEGGWDKIHSKYCNEIYSFSSPLFNKTFTKGIIRLAMTCGSICGHGGVYLIEKRNGKWNIVKVYEEWWI